MIRKLVPCLIVVALVALGSLGCGQGQESAGEASLTDTANKMAETAGKMTDDATEAGGDLLEQAEEAAESLGTEAKAKYDEYAAALEEKKGELEELKSKLSDMSPQDMLSGEGKDLKEKADLLQTEVGELGDKLKKLLEEAQPS